MAAVPCGACKGARLKPETLAVTVADMNIHGVTAHGRARGASTGSSGSPARTRR